jgi:hypothetical protein
MLRPTHRRRLAATRGPQGPSTVSQVMTPLASEADSPVADIYRRRVVIYRGRI